MHDRRIEGETYAFGNAGGLYLGAMTWWDHKTQSIWSQPVGEALAGPLDGARLDLLPSQVTTWGNWVSQHPTTFVMVNDLDRLGRQRQGFSANFVIGVIVGDAARAYYYRDIDGKVVNDVLGDFPLVIWAHEGDYRVYLRSIQNQELSFDWGSDGLVDQETGTTWDAGSGLAKEGALQGSVLQPLPSLTSFDWAWQDFYPQADFYEP